MLSLLRGAVRCCRAAACTATRCSPSLASARRLWCPTGALQLHVGRAVGGEGRDRCRGRVQTRTQGAKTSGSPASHLRATRARAAAATAAAAAVVAVRGRSAGAGAASQQRVGCGGGQRRRDGPCARRARCCRRATLAQPRHRRRVLAHHRSGAAAVRAQRGLALRPQQRAAGARLAAAAAAEVYSESIVVWVGGGRDEPERGARQAAARAHVLQGAAQQLRGAVGRRAGGWAGGRVLTALMAQGCRCPALRWAPSCSPQLLPPPAHLLIPVRAVGGAPGRRPRPRLPRRPPPLAKLGQQQGLAQAAGQRHVAVQPGQREAQALLGVARQWNGSAGLGVLSGLSVLRR